MLNFPVPQMSRVGIGKESMTCTARIRSDSASKLLLGDTYLSLRNQNEELKEQVAQYASKLKEATEELVTKRARVYELSSELEQRGEKLGKAEKETRDYRDMVERLDATHAELHASALNLSHHKCSLEKRIVELEKQQVLGALLTAELNEEKRVLVTWGEKMRVELSELHMKHEAALKDKNEARKELGKAKARVEKDSKLHEGVKTQRNKIMVELSNLRSENSNLKEKVRNLWKTIQLRDREIKTALDTNNRMVLHTRQVNNHAQSKKNIEANIENTNSEGKETPRQHSSGITDWTPRPYTTPRQKYNI